MFYQLMLLFLVASRCTHSTLPWQRNKQVS